MTTEKAKRGPYLKPVAPCESCGTAVRCPPSRLKGRPYIYCSRECYQADRPNKPRKKRTDVGPANPKWNRIDRPCSWCGKSIWVTQFVAQRRKLSFCSRSHAASWYKLHPSSPKGRPTRPIGSTKPQNRGYMYEKTEQGWRVQHRVVMERALGRPLTDDENVHHKNGMRRDNRLENLELWSKMQPTGKRIVDLVAFAREVLDRYGVEVDQTPDVHGHAVTAEHWGEAAESGPSLRPTG